jgi:type IV secretion system protein VirB10
MIRFTGAAFVFALAAAGQEPAQSLQPAVPVPPAPKTFRLEPGTRIPMNLLNSVSTRNAAEGDRVYLETVYPIMAGGKIVIPPGSSVAGTLTRVKRPGRVKGKGELYLRFDELILPNGTVRDFRAGLGAIDGRDRQEFDRAEGGVKGEGNKGGDAVNVAYAGASGAGVGAMVGSAAGNVGQGAAIGGLAGAGAALAGVLLTRGPDVVLAKGSTLEMSLDRQLVFTEGEIDFSDAFPGRPRSDGPGPQSTRPPTRRPGIF